MPKFLNKKQASKILKQIESQFSCETKHILNNYYFYLSKKDKLHIINKDISKINISNLNIMTIGLYFSKIEKDGIRLTIEGSQLIKNPKTNILTLSKDQYQKYISGQTPEINRPNSYVLIKYNNEFLGTAKIINKTLYNYIPKERRAKL
jgi:NOL1/NOP2/fmu family ribosome biogenesis protein